MRAMLALTVAVSLSACSWVKLTPEGEKVRVLSAQEVTQCKRMGQTTVSVLGTIGRSERDLETMEKELKVLARNSAIDLKGDTVVPISQVKDGRQTFGVYRCMPQ